MTNVKIKAIITAVFYVFHLTYRPQRVTVRVINQTVKRLGLYRSRVASAVWIAVPFEDLSTIAIGWHLRICYL